MQAIILSIFLGFFFGLEDVNRGQQVCQTQVSFQSFYRIYGQSLLEEKDKEY